MNLPRYPDARFANLNAGNILELKKPTLEVLKGNVLKPNFEEYPDRNAVDEDDFSSDLIEAWWQRKHDVTAAAVRNLIGMPAGC